MTATATAPKIKLVSKGNAKLGPNIWHTNLPAGESCPGRSEWCSATDGGACYAGKGFYVLQRQKYQAQLSMLRETPTAFEEQLLAEVAKLPIGGVFRWHTSGDIESVEHVGIIRRVCQSRPDVTFYLYTRSHAVPELREAIEALLFDLPNLYVWASLDRTMADAPEGWRIADVVQDVEHKRQSGPVCPEQTGRKASCSDCGLCWNARPDARLTFLEH